MKYFIFELIFFFYYDTEIHNVYDKLLENKFVLRQKNCKNFNLKKCLIN